MCGISGLINKSNNFNSKKGINLMVNSMQHRGPDNKEILKLNNCDGYLGHNRLSIIELSKFGNQPMSYKHLTITYNGEVYNYLKIKSQLQNSGYSFKGNSDTEVILKAFDYWGIACVDRFIGMFAFSVYDSKKNKIYLFRDRSGVKPLYYSFSEKGFLFASEQKAILQLIKCSINFQSLSDYLHRGYINNLNTFYNEICELNQGSFLIFDVNKHKILINSYWSSEEIYKSKKKSTTLKYDTLKYDLKSLLKDSFNYRMLSDVPVGVFLSSGFDSTLVAALLSQDQEINTFTIGFEEKKYDESKKAKKIAKHLKTNHTEIICSSNEIEDFVSKLPSIYDEPFGDTSCLPTLLVNKHASKYVKVVLSADGGDEQFGGYSHYELTESIFNYYNLYKKLGFLKYIRKPVISILKILNNYEINAKCEILKLFDLNKNDFINNFHVEQEHLSFYTKDLFKKFNKPTKNFNLNLNFEYKNWEELLMLNDYNNYMVNILKKIDRASMYHSIESRDPFLDHRIFEFSTNLPLHFKINYPLKKIIIRDLVYDLIPKDLLEQKKVGFGIPIVEWFKDYMFDYFIDNFSEVSIKDSNIFNPSQVLLFRDNFLKSNKNNYYINQIIWRLFTINQWENQYKKYFTI
tara:strand:+ start:2762 stop:4657 length:1896 start_codon:yes stop_codon:yes gene_type:complete